MKKIKAAIIGGAGYTGGELIRLLLLHPHTDLVSVQSTSSAGKKIYEVHTDLLGETEMLFSEGFPNEANVIFLCGGHDTTRKFMAANKLPPQMVVIDLSQDFRHSDNNIVEDRTFIYGLPELNRKKIKTAQSIANPGCFATSIELALLPLASVSAIKGDVHITATTGTEGEIRKNMIEAGLVDCMVALPSQLFYNTMIPACLWFLARNRSNGKYRNRSNEILFIDARNLGVLVNRRNRELPDEQVKQIAETYHDWRNLKGKYEDIQGFCKAATIDEVRNNNYVLMPGRYVGTEEEEEDTEPFADKMQNLTDKLSKQFAQSDTLKAAIRKNLKSIGYEF